MSGPVLALRRAVREHLVADATLAGLLDSPGIHDEPPPRQPAVHAVFGEVASEPDIEGVAVQTLEILVSGRPGSTAAALLAADRIAALLDGADLALQGASLAALRLTRIAAARDAATGLARVALRFRAVTQ